MREQILRKQEIVSQMKTALETGQFEMWMQPQYNHATCALVGAEALVRWRHPKRGLISPGKFIPIFERNGFIYELDTYIWEQVCILLRKWLDAGRSPLPVSVNVSRYDIFRDDLFDVLTGLVEWYRIPVELLRLEITESAFATSASQIIRVVRRLIDYGFLIEIDDFGSGYSSLNTLKDVPAGIIKLDMRFLENKDGSPRGGNILESIIRMAKWLGTPVIAEGVETREQADFLRSIGCSYVQGSLYAKPMPVYEYELLAWHATKEQGMIALGDSDLPANNAFWDPHSMETLIFNSYVGGAFIFEYHSGETEMIRVNQNYAQELIGSTLSMETALSIKLTDYMDEDTRGKMHETIRTSIESGTECAAEIKLYDLPGRDGYTYLRVAIRVIARTDDRILFYGTVINVTAQREAEQRAHRTAAQLKAIMENVSSGISAVLCPGPGIVRVAFANEKYFEIFGYTRQQFEAEVPNAFALIHPSDADRVDRTISNLLLDTRPASFDYRCFRRDGSIIHVLCSTSLTAIEGIGERVLISVLTDNTAFIRAEQKAVEASRQLQTILSGISGGISAVTVSDGGTVRFLFANDQYFEQIGYTRARFEQESPSFLDLLYPDDRDGLLAKIRQAKNTGAPFTAEYRVIRPDGRLILLQSHVSITSFPGIDAPVQLSVSYLLDPKQARKADASA